MRILDSRLKNRIINNQNLIDFGFINTNDCFILEKNITSDFKVIITIHKDTITSKVIDIETNEEYILVDISDSIGEYASKIKNEYELLLQDFINKCSSKVVFKSIQAQQIIEYVKSNFEGELEFLWDDEDCAIWRNLDNKKWYGLLMNVDVNKLDNKRNGYVDIINLKYEKDKSDEVVDNKHIFKAYHMNKHSWISIILDNTLDINKIFKLINNSYNLIK